MATVLLNGAFVGLDEAKLSALDASVQHGVGLFETMLGGVRDGEAWVVDLDAHVERLCTSAAELGLSTDLRAPALEDAVLQTVARSGLARARVRLTITGGDLNLLSRSREAPRDGGGGGGGAKSGGGTFAGAAHPTVLCVAQPATVYPRAMLERGVMATLADSKANPFDLTTAHKTLNYWWRLRELQIAGAKGAGEALVFDVTNHFCGGCVSNALLVKDGVLMTPIARGEEGLGPQGRSGSEGSDGPDVAAKRGPGAFLPSPVLPGVTRQRVLEWAELGPVAGAGKGLGAADGDGAFSVGLRVERRMLTINDVLSADELMLTNSSWGVLPIVKVESRAIGAGAPGPVTRALVDRWAKWTGAM